MGLLSMHGSVIWADCNDGLIMAHVDSKTLWHQMLIVAQIWNLIGNFYLVWQTTTASFKFFSIYLLLF